MYMFCKRLFVSKLLNLGILTLVLKTKMSTFQGNDWATGLIKQLSDNKYHIISSNIGVVIKDKYPKAQHHYLVLPREDIPSILDLREHHLPILEELYLLGLNIIEIQGLEKNDFNLGFHAKLSMRHLHMHVISRDFISECLKNKKHWNSFNTNFFLPYKDVYKVIKDQGTVKSLEDTEIKKLLSSELKCNQCEFVAKNIPNLKSHLLTHRGKS